MNDTKQPVWRPTAESLKNAFLSSGKRHLIITGERGSGKTTLLYKLLLLLAPDFLSTGSSYPDLSETTPVGRLSGSGSYFPFSLPGFTTAADWGNAARYTVAPACIRICDHSSRRTAIIGLPAESPFLHLEYTSQTPVSDHISLAACTDGISAHPDCAGRNFTSTSFSPTACTGSISAHPDCSGQNSASTDISSAHPGRLMRPVPEGFRSVGLDALQAALLSPAPFAVLDELGYLEAQQPDFCRLVWQLFEKRPVAAVLRRQHLPLLDRILARTDVFVIDLSAPLPRIGAIVMASGASRRFRSAKSQDTAAVLPASENSPACTGRENKLLADFHGEPLITPVLRLAASPLFTARIAVTRNAMIQALCRQHGFPCLLHSQPLLSDTIRLGIDALDTRFPDPDGCLFLQGDQPLLSPVSIEALLDAFAAEPGCIHRLSWQSHPGSPVLFPAFLFDELRHLPPDCGGSAVIRNHRDLVRTTEASCAEELADIDTPKELARLARINNI